MRYQLFHRIRGTTYLNDEPITKNIHQPNCAWEKAECPYKASHYYCPHPEHTCTCPAPTTEGSEKELAERFIAASHKYANVKVSIAVSAERERIRKAIEKIADPTQCVCDCHDKMDVKYCSRCERKHMNNWDWSNSVLFKEILASLTPEAKT
jgi:hypothetical protein